MACIFRLRNTCVKKLLLGVFLGESLTPSVFEMCQDSGWVNYKLVKIVISLLSLAAA